MFLTQNPAWRASPPCRLSYWRDGRNTEAFCRIGCFPAWKKNRGRLGSPESHAYLMFGNLALTADHILRLST
jgi:hypothetical protein